MLEQFFDSPSRIRELRESSHGRLLAGFARELYHEGYAEITARRHLRAAEHLSYWISRKGTPISALDDQALHEFSRHLDRCSCPRYGCRNKADLQYGGRLFAAYLDRSGVVADATAKPPSPDPMLLSAFCDWMRRQRGTCDSTLCNYCRHLRALLKALGEDPSAFDARGLREFVLKTSRRHGWAAKTCTTAVRMFLRFLIADGKCAADLEAAVPVLAHWRLSSLPRCLQSDEVERVIASCNLETPVGRRDRAILLLLARLALRADDILQLRLHDIDWRGAWIHVSGKGRVPTRLPLTQEIGDAIAAYLTNARPQAEDDALFVRCRAPFRAWRSHCAVSVIVARAMRRAGVSTASRGAAHVLRHSAASSMLRQGASLQQIAAILRHRSIETTQIYAKVDAAALQQVAQPWPEVQPC